MLTKIGDQTYYVVDHVRYDSEDSYKQIMENHRIQGIAAKALYDQNPGGYPKCTNDPPVGPEAQCGNESCDLHNILWLEFDGCTHEQAIGLTAVYNQSDNQSGVGSVAEALGGMDEFNLINEEGANVPAMVAWYDQHQPLVRYFMESQDRELLEFWYCAKYPGRYMPTNVTGYMVVDPSGQDGWSTVLGPNGKVWSTDIDEVITWGFGKASEDPDPTDPRRKRKIVQFTFDKGRGY